MNSQSSSAPAATPTRGSKPSETSADPASVRSGSQPALSDSLGEILGQLSREMGGLKDSFARLASQAGDVGAKTVRNVGHTVASQVGSATSGMVDTGSDLASSAKEHAKTFASELESMARRNPLGTIAGTLLVGVIIGMMARGRG
jgi:ElaB/YqjD/DUF883 family membrane-anchored ribosome-binding protein